jgi:hypothetical protein
MYSIKQVLECLQGEELNKLHEEMSATLFKIAFLFSSPCQSQCELLPSLGSFYSIQSDGLSIS